MKKVTNTVKIESDKKDFTVVLNIITARHSRPLMSVNVESLLIYWER